MGAVLPVGDPARRTAGVAVLVALAVAGLFAAYTVVAKEAPVLYGVQPWQDDPYDALVSFDFVALPLLVAAGLARVRLCRRYAPLPVRRVADLLRLCGVVTGLALLTQLAEWVATATGAPDWTFVTAGQLAVLATFTAATVTVRLLLRRARRELGRAHTAGAQPDWLADGIALVVRETRPFPALHGATVPLAAWVDAHLVARVRAHPVVAAGIAAVVLSLPELGAKLLIERYPLALAAYVFILTAATLFAFIVAASAYLRVVASRSPQPSAWLVAGIAAGFGAALAAAFRDSLLALAGIRPTSVTLSTLILVTVCGAAAGGLAALAATPLRHRLQHRLLHRDAGLRR